MNHESTHFCRFMSKRSVKLRASLAAFAMATALCSGAQISDSELRLWLPFEGNANDESGLGNNGVVFGAQLTQDRFGAEDSAYFFDGIDDFIDIGGNKSLRPPLPMSIAAWVRLDSNELMPFFANNYAENRYTGFFANFGASWQVNVGDGGGPFSTNRRTLTVESPVELGVWHHLAAVATSEDTMRVFIDGIQVCGVYSGTGGQLAYTESDSGRIGEFDYFTSAPPRFFSGAADEIAFYGRALQPIEVSVLADLGNDFDGDGIPNTTDNCVLRPNPNQQDADADGYGNVCDGDFNNDCVVNVIDLGVLRTQFFSGDPLTDLNSDGVVNVVDLGIFRTLFFGSPGPSILTGPCGCDDQ